MIKLERFCEEFITLYDDDDNEIVEFQSTEFEKLENSICTLLNYLGVKYEI